MHRGANIISMHKKPQAMICAERNIRRSRTLRKVLLVLYRIGIKLSPENASFRWRAISHRRLCIDYNDRPWE